MLPSTRPTKHSVPSSAPLPPSLPSMPLPSAVPSPPPLSSSVPLPSAVPSPPPLSSSVPPPPDDAPDTTANTNRENPQRKLPGYFDTLVMSGGGILGTAHLGACWVLEHQGHLASITRFIGTSIGALIGALLAMRFPVLAIEEYLTGRQIYDMVFEHPNFSNHMFGKHESLIQTFQSFVERALGQGSGNITFAEIYAAFGVDLQIAAVEYSKKDVFMFTHQSTPHMPVIHAVAASMAYPELVGRVVLNDEEEDWHFIDGGLLYNFPIAEAPGPRTLGICAVSPFAYTTEQKGGYENIAKTRPALRLAHWVYYVSTCANKFFLKSRGLDCEEDALATILRIPTHEDFSPLDMKHDRDTLYALFQHGKTYMQEEIKTW